ncbi:Hsp20/alpha crystallin family protein [Pedobacter sp. SYP-B3415]|uniref:Hsp20/alpha crystallin family protein n=1 Tax=Pedobacter sp. SYP-B3415 TaxID=2496641 RepID=UPI00101DABE7|nr:Hsp20/alpha crystallin family protein [Pedobacter sp. SYP-B3415]
MTLVKFNNRTRNHVPYFNNVFDSLFNDALIKTGRPAQQPQVNISETEQAYHIEVAAPGLKKEDFQVTVNESVLSVSVDKKTEQAEEAKGYTRKEFTFSSFRRSFNLPETADESQISAAYTDGILNITIGKKEESKPEKRSIEVA